MGLNALRGALGFLTRLPVGRDEAAWAAFRASPVAFPLAGYVLGGLVAVPFLFEVPAPVLAAGYVGALVLLVGATHADGLADVGDAAATVGAPVDRRRSMRDTAVGAGGVLAVATALVGLALGALAVATLPTRAAVGVALTAEVGAKLAVATVVCVGESSHAGMGREFTARASEADLLVPALVSLPVVLASGSLLVGAAALLSAVALALWVTRWATRRLDGVGGDVLGATNELARVVSLHAGVVAWTLW